MKKLNKYNSTIAQEVAGWDQMTRRQRNTISKRQFDDRADAIDDQLDEALSKVDRKRREAAEKSLASWVKTYCVPLLLQDMPSERGFQVLGEMERALTAHSNYMICMPRGSGKSSFVTCAALYALATGLQKYVVVISANARAASGIMNDIARAVVESDTDFAQDYPEVALPFQLAGGAYRRRMTYGGKSLDIRRNSGELILGRLDGFMTSQSLVTCRGIGGGLRGMKFGNLRPSLVILDDLQTSEIAENPSSVKKLLSLIRKDIMPLGGKERLSILQTATPIAPEDLVESLQNDKAWKTTTFKGIEKFPNRMDLWERYFKIYDGELVDDADHSRSLEFYKANRKLMDEGAETFNPSRYSEKDGHISAIQKLLEIQHMIGDAAFQSEYQMKPKRFSFKLDITPKDVVQKVVDVQRLVVPDGYVFVAASTDLNLSYALTTAIVAFKPDMTAHVVHYVFTPCKIDMKLADAEYNRRLYDALMRLALELKSLNIKIDGWGIDASGRPFDTVTDFAKHSPIPACAMLGRASHMFNPYVRTRLRDAINNTILCGDAQEHVKAGAGRKYQFWNSDYWREAVHKAWLMAPGSQGSCTLFKGDSDDHAEYAMQICNERLLLIQHKRNGQDIYTWKTQEPHDALDATAQAFAIAASQGISGNNVAKPASSRRQPMRKRPKIRIA